VEYTIAENHALNSSGVEVASLIEFSARIGQDPLLVQASSGNTSIKVANILWIKASGKWLARAKQEPIMVPVRLETARETLRTGGDISKIHVASGALRPSVETAMHAALPHRVVIHVHSINTIAWAVRKDAQAQLSRRLQGLHWQLIPYSASGIPLARQLESSLSRAPQTNIFVLANHGLVVCGDDFSDTEKILRDVEGRLKITPRKSPQGDDALSFVTARSADWCLPDCPELHALGADPAATRILRGGILFPCQAIFLGQNVRILPRSVPLSRYPDYSNGRSGARTFVVVDGAGVIIHRKISDSQRAILNGLVQVIQRTDEFAPIRYLSAAELTDLFSEDPHPYLVNMEGGTAPRGSVSSY
jgi:rhamnose utilization protein RhaD (predicted bifunctional aldolase and dehydrogenase)